MSAMTVEEYKASKMNAERNEAKKGMIAHTIVTALVSCLLVAINLIATPTVTWVVFPLAGMWAGVAIHYAMVTLFLEKELARRYDLA